MSNTDFIPGKVWTSTVGVSSNIIALIDSSEIFGVQDFYSFIDPILEMSEYDSQLWLFDA